MATSSITANFTISDPKAAQAFATAFIRNSRKSTTPCCDAVASDYQRRHGTSCCMQVQRPYESSCLMEAPVVIPLNVWMANKSRGEIKRFLAGFSCIDQNKEVDGLRIFAQSKYTSISMKTTSVGWRQ